jgi:hypothetical protein
MKGNISRVTCDVFRTHGRYVLLGYDTVLPGTDPENYHIHLHRIKTLKYIRSSWYIPRDIITIISITVIIIIIIIIIMAYSLKARILEP